MTKATPDVPKKNKPKKVYFIRLLSGDDLIAEITKKTKLSFIVKNPMLILNQLEIEEGRQTLIMYPWIPQGIALGNTAEIKMDNLLMMNDLEPDIQDYYEGMCEMAFTRKPKAVASSIPKGSDLKGTNILDFGVRGKKDLSH
jgi:hypothetical protein